MPKEMLFLCDVYDKYLDENDLPHRSACDILYGENAMALTSNQKYWLESFISTWDIIAQNAQENQMTYDSEHYYAVQTFLDDDELCKIWNIIEIAMNREGYDVENAELSMRLYDSELEENIEHDMENLL